MSELRSINKIGNPDCGVLRIVVHVMGEFVLEIIQMRK